MGRGSKNVLYAPVAARAKKEYLKPQWFADYSQQLIATLQNLGVASKNWHALELLCRHPRPGFDFEKLNKELCRQRLLNDLRPLVDAWPLNFGNVLVDLTNQAASLMSEADPERLFVARGNAYSNARLLNREIPGQQQRPPVLLAGQEKPSRVSYKAAEATLQSLTTVLPEQGFSQREAMTLAEAAILKSVEAGGKPRQTRQGIYEREAQRLSSFLQSDIFL